MKTQELLDQMRQMRAQIELLELQNRTMQRELDKSRPTLKPATTLQYNPSTLSIEDRHSLEYHTEQTKKFAEQITKTEDYLKRLRTAQHKHQEKCFKLQMKAMVQI